MAYHDIKEIDVRGRKVLVYGVKTGIRNYTFRAKIGHHESNLSLHIGELGDLQEHFNTARQKVAEQCLSEFEHLEREAEID